MEHVFRKLALAIALLVKSPKHGTKSAKDYEDVELNEDKEKQREDLVQMRRVDSGHSVVLGALISSLKHHCMPDDSLGSLKIF